MKRIILDTNIYGRIVEKKEEEEVKELVEKHPEIIIYGYDIIRKELRDTSKRVRIERRSLRLILLGIYDKLTQKHTFYTTSAINRLADDYYKTYKELGGKRPLKEMQNDFLIVACASIHELDIVVSEDNKTMLVDDAIKSYRIVNGLQKYRTPKFINYLKFRRLFS